ncbi:MAG: sigma 54-interacting transcriptional regulator [Alphaproteobacteria bacterium]|nr:sigma 54-interacting transcriptional regulator [Alphaproteobacteria bacterium]
MCAQAFRQFQAVSLTFQDVDALRAERDLREASLKGEATRLKVALGDVSYPVAIGPSEASVALRKQIAALSDSRRRVLIIGPYGTPKADVAKAVYDAYIAEQAKTRKSISVVNRFQTLVCRSDMAFTDVRNACIAAADGTLYLHHVDMLAPEIQNAFAKFLGMPAKHGQCRVRLISSAHREEDMTPDLRARLDLETIALAPLNERRADIPAMVEHMFVDARRKTRLWHNATMQSTMPVALSSLDWPANDMQLFNAIERLCIVAKANGASIVRMPEIAEKRRPLEAAQNIDLDLVTARNAFEIAFIEAHLLANGGNISKAALTIDMTRPALTRKIHAMGIRQK